MATTGDSSSEERMKESAKQAAGSLQDEARGRLEGGKSTVARSARRTADALHQAADSLSAEGEGGLSQAFAVMADQLSALSASVERRSLDELSRDAQRLARENPGIFIAGGVVLGVALTRFFKASTPKLETASSPKTGVAGEGRPPAPPAAAPARPGETPEMVTPRNLGGGYE